MSAKSWNPSKYVKKRVLRILVSALVAIAVCCIGFILNQRKAIALEVDGKTKEVVTYTDSLPKFLKQQGITVHTHDQAVSSSGYWLTNGAVVKVRRAYEVMVDIGGHLIPYWTLASSAEQLENYFLQNDKEAAKISVNIPNVYNALTGGINLNASGPIEVIAFGKSYNVKNGNQPAASILDSLGITITSNDLVSVEHTGGKTILVVERVSYGTETQDVMTAYSVKTVDNPNAYVGTTTIEQKGSYGEQQQTLKVTYINGKPVATQLMGAKVIKQSQPEIIEVGTKKKPAPKPVEPKKEENEPKAQASTQDQKKQQSQPQQQKSQPAQKPAQTQSQPKKEENEPKAQASTQDQKSQPAQKPAQTQSQPKKEENEPKAQASTQDQKSQPAQKPAQTQSQAEGNSSSSSASPATPAQTPQPAQTTPSTTSQSSSSSSNSAQSQAEGNSSSSSRTSSQSSQTSSSSASPATPAQTPQPAQTTPSTTPQSSSQVSPADSSSELSGELTPAEAQTFAAGVAEDQYGWGSTQFSCLVELWNRESGWMWDAENVYSGAYGIAQALPPSKMGTGWEYNAKVQIDWGLSYILERYTTPCGAWNHEITYGWY